MAKIYAPRIRLTPEEYNYILELRNKKNQNPLDNIDKEIVKHLLKNKLSLEELCDAVRLHPGAVKEKISKLKELGYNINIYDDKLTIDDNLPTNVKHTKESLDIKWFSGDKIKIGYVSDNHLGSYCERLDVLNTLYDIFEQEGITMVLNGGNIIEGEARFNFNEIHTFGMTRQIKYAVEHYPYREGIKTYFITADDHEGWYVKREGINIGDYLQSERQKAGKDDLVHLGYLEADIELNGTNFQYQCWIKVMHPGGGSAYAHSYKPQKIVEGLQGGEKPVILFIGHYHKASYNYIRNVHVIQMGCTADQSIFLRKKNIEVAVGGGWIEITRNPLGIITDVKYTFIPFFDRKFYVGKDKFLKY